MLYRILGNDIAFYYLFGGEGMGAAVLKCDGCGDEVIGQYMAAGIRRRMA